MFTRATTPPSNLSARWPLAALTSTLLALGCSIGCKGDDASADDESGTAGTAETNGDGDPGDGDPGDGDGDGDGDPGDGDGDSGCTEQGCPCGDDGDCGPSLACIGGTCEMTICGDGVVEGDEECEDGNAVDGDGCDSDCTFTRVNAVATGVHHTCALIDGGKLVCWGRGEFGQLGYGNVNNVGDDELPSDVGPIETTSAVLKVDLGGQHSCAVFDDGGLRCWGLNDRGQLGNGTIANFGDDEPLVALPPISVPPTLEIEAGERHTCARVGNGEVRCWGYNTEGNLGYASLAPEILLPGGAVSLVSPSAGLAVGFWHSCANFVDGGMRCWGRNDNGQLGYGNTAHIGDNELPSAVGTVSILPPTVADNTEIVDISLGGNHGCALLSTGDLMCWGANGSGQLGYGNLNNVGDDEAANAALPVDLGGAVLEVDCGANHTCARIEGGDVLCWGDNSVGQLGLGNTDNVGDDELPLDIGPVSIGGAVVQLSTGGNHTCALMANADVRCWGQNNFSQLGLGSSVTIGDNETPSEVEPVSVF